MPITAKPKVARPTDPAGAFVEAAPDVGRAPRAPAKGARKQQVTFVLRPELVERLDAECLRLGISRSAMIALAVGQFLERGLQLNVPN